MFTLDICKYFQVLLRLLVTFISQLNATWITFICPYVTSISNNLNGPGHIESFRCGTNCTTSDLLVSRITLPSLQATEEAGISCTSGAKITSIEHHTLFLS